MITCDVIRDLLPLYADDLLSQSSRELVDTHIAACPECKQMLDTMLRPLDPEPAEVDFAGAIRRNKRKQRRRVFLVCTLIVFACVLGWWIYMETHFYGETPKVVTTDEAKILAEVPQLALTEAELALAEPLFREPVLLEAMEAGEIGVDVSPDQVAHLLTGIMPDDTSAVYVTILSERNICIDFWGTHHRIILEYLDIDQTGTVDQIRKTVAVMEKSGDVRVVYGLEHFPGFNLNYYEKLQLKHIWFSFLDPFFQQ